MCIWLQILYRKLSLLVTNLVRNMCVLTPMHQYLVRHDFATCYIILNRTPSTIVNIFEHNNCMFSNQWTIFAGDLTCMMITPIIYCGNINWWVYRVESCHPPYTAYTYYYSFNLHGEFPSRHVHQSLGLYTLSKWECFKTMHWTVFTTERYLKKN